MKNQRIFGKLPLLIFLLACCGTDSIAQADCATSIQNLPIYLSYPNLDCNTDQISIRYFEYDIIQPGTEATECVTLWNTLFWTITYDPTVWSVTDLGSFDDGQIVNPNGTVTIIDDINTPLFSSGLRSHLTSGIFNGVGSFTVTLEDGDGLIYQSMSFNNDPGSPIGNILLSEAIEDGLLLDPSIAKTVPQSVELNGSLSIDQDYTFAPGSSIIAATSSASIDVEQSTRLTINDVILYSCNNSIWNGIRVGGKLEFSKGAICDAYVGVNVLSGGEWNAESNNSLNIWKCTYGVILNEGCTVQMQRPFYTANITDCYYTMKVNGIADGLLMRNWYITGDNGMEVNNTDLDLGMSKFS